jgi:excisionase family DNA binding protein
MAHKRAEVTGAETTQAGYGGMLGLVSIIILFVRASGTAPRNHLALQTLAVGVGRTPVHSGSGAAAGSAARKGCAVAAQPSPKAAITSSSYLRAAEVADILHVSPKTVSRWAKEGKLPFLKTLGGHRRYPEAEIRELAERLREETTA